MGEGTFNLFDFSADLNPVKKALGGKVPSSDKPAVYAPSYSPDYSVSQVRKKNIPSAKSELPPSVGVLKPDEVKFLMDKGYGTETIMKLGFPDKKAEEKPIEKDFFDKVSESGKERFETALKVSEDENMSGVTQALATGGEAIGFLGDVVGSAISSATPEEVKSFLKIAAGKTWNAMPEPVKENAVSAIKGGAEAWGKFSESYPETARNLTSIAQISEILPVEKGISALGKGVKAGGDIVSKIPKNAVSAYDATKGAVGETVDKLGVKGVEAFGPIINRKEVAEGGGIYKDGKFVGTQTKKDTALRRVLGGEGTEYNAKLAEKVVADISPEDLDRMRKSVSPEKVLGEVMKKKVDEVATLQKKVAQSNKNPIPESAMMRVSEGGTISENPLRLGINKLETSKGLTVDEREAIANWRKKLDTEGGLSAEDVSDISIMMGNKQGDFKQLINGVEAKDIEYERLRKEVKDVYHRNSPPQAQALNSILHAQLDFSHFVKEMGENVAKARAQFDNSLSAKFGKALSNVWVVGPALNGIVKGLLRTDFGTGKAGAVLLEAQDYADELVKNIERAKRMADEVGSAKTIKEAEEIIRNAEKELKLLPAPKTNYQNPAEINVSPIKVPKGGFNSPEITPKSVIRKPSTTVKPKPYKEPNYKTPLQRKKNIPKPKPMKI